MPNEFPEDVRTIVGMFEDVQLRLKRLETIMYTIAGGAFIWFIMIMGEISLIQYP